MKVTLRPLSEQVIVITGASSGIGLVTAKTAARAGAAVVLAARNAADLERAVAQIRAEGGRALAVKTDVADPAQVAELADTAINELGRIDTWVNNAAVSLYGRIMDVPLADFRRQMDVNYWGQVHGSRCAVQRMRRRGGALINVASALADRAVPLQGNYCAAKHALKAFTDTLRMELDADGVPICVTLVKPASIDTPFFDKARTYLGVEPRPIPPVYAPEVVARVILNAAQHPVREVVAGGAAATLSVARLAPRITDRYMTRTTFASQESTRPANGRPDNLYAAVPADGGERGRHWSGHTRERSLYTTAVLHPRRAGVLLVALAAALMSATAMRARRSVPRAA
jgi:NAD(P)-dependent dehydrogenase (short-subunit alcohol dehydrogenase family)